MSDGDKMHPGVLDELRSVIADLSGLPPTNLSEDASFMDLGLDSLLLTQLAQALQRKFGVKISFRQLSDSLPTLRAVALHVSASRPAPVAATPAPAPVAAPAAATMPAPAPTMQLPLPTAAAVSGAPASALQQIFRQQLDLMQQQLLMLGGARAAAMPAAEVAPAAAAVAASVATEVAAPAAAATEPKAAEPVMTSGPFRPIKRATDGRLTPHQESRLHSLVQRYAERHAGSKRLAQSQRRRHADPRTASGFNKRWKEMCFPITVERSLGAHLWDVDGNKFVDLLSGFGPNLLGWQAPMVVEAIDRQMRAGFEVGPSTRLAGEVADLVCELTGMDRASLVCTGSEAVQAAIRCARTVTGRDKVVVFTRDYHGNFDEVLVRAANRGKELRTLPSAPGIPFRAVDDVWVLEYGTPEALEIIRTHADDLAAVMVEPVQSRRPEWRPAEFLHELRAITKASGTALIFDEIVTGFRCHQGGAQAHFGIEADLATYGKVIGGGMPLGVVAGRDRWMDTFDGGQWQFGDDSVPEAGVTFFAGTFVRHPLAVAAAHATLTYLKAAGPSFQEQLNKVTDGFVGEINAILHEAGVKAKLHHFGSQMYLRNEEESELAPLLWYELRARGVHLLEGFPSYLTAAHTPADLQHCVQAFRDAVDAMLEAGFFDQPARERPAAKVVAVSTAPPVPGARLGRDADGTPAWFVPDPERPSKFLRVAATR